MLSRLSYVRYNSKSLYRRQATIRGFLGLLSFIKTPRVKARMAIFVNIILNKKHNFRKFILQLLNLVSSLYYQSYFTRLLVIGLDNLNKIFLAKPLAIYRIAGFFYKQWVPGLLTNFNITRVFLARLRYMQRVLFLGADQTRVSKKLPNYHIKTLKFYLRLLALLPLQNRLPLLTGVFGSELHFYPLTDELVSLRLLTTGISFSKKWFSFNLFGNSENFFVRFHLLLLMVGGIILVKQEKRQQTKIELQGVEMAKKMRINYFVEDFFLNYWSRITGSYYLLNFLHKIFILLLDGFKKISFLT